MADEKRITELENGEKFKYVPSVCVQRKRVTEGGVEEIINPTFAGHVVLKRITLLKKLELAPKVDEARGQDSHGFKATAVAIEGTLGLWDSVELTHLASGKKYASVNELMIDGKCDQIVVEVALGHVDGFVSIEAGESQGN